VFVIVHGLQCIERDVVLGLGSWTLVVLKEKNWSPSSLRLEYLLTSLQFSKKSLRIYTNTLAYIVIN